MSTVIDVGNIRKRWNTLATSFVGIGLHVVDQNSDPGSLLFQLSCGPTTTIVPKFTVDKSGNCVANSFSGDGSGLTGVASGGDVYLANANVFTNTNTFRDIAFSAHDTYSIGVTGTRPNKVWVGTGGINSTGPGLFTGGLQSYFSNVDGVVLGNGAADGAFARTSDAIAIGYQAHALPTATTQFGIYLGRHAGYAALGNNAVVIGHAAAQYAPSVASSVIIGYLAGRNLAQSASHFAFSAVIIGHEAGTNGLSTQNSVMVGSQAGKGATSCVAAVFLGYSAGENSTTGTFAVMAGFNTGKNATSAANSVMLGYEAGMNSTPATNCVFIGNGAGKSLNRASSLIIDGNTTYSNTNTGLIYGEFDNRMLRINGNFQVIPRDNAIGLTISGSTLTAANAQSLVSLSQTWNTTGNPSLIYGNVSTYTAAGTTAKLLRLDVGGIEYFGVRMSSGTAVSLNVGNAAASNVVLGPTSLVTSNGGFDVQSVNAGVRLIAATTIELRCDATIFSSTAGTTAISVDAVTSNLPTFTGVDTLGLYGTLNGVRIGKDASNFAWFTNNVTLTGMVVAVTGNIWHQSNQTNAQIFRLYRTFTDASNHAYLEQTWSGNNALIRTVGLGTGTVGDLILQASTYTFTFSASTAQIALPSPGGISWTSRSRIKSTNDGLINLLNAASSSFTRFTLGPESVNFPSLKVNSGVGVQFKKGDDSVFCRVEADDFLSQAPSGGTAHAWKFGSDEGAAPAVFITSKYARIEINGVKFWVNILSDV